MRSLPESVGRVVSVIGKGNYLRVILVVGIIFVIIFLCMHGLHSNFEMRHNEH